MKKIILTIVIAITTCAGFAADYDCQNPNSIYTYSGQQYACGTTNTPNTICYYRATGQIPAGNNVYGCDTPAPINSGLIFLIIAAIGVGTTVVYKKEQMVLK
jgi:hypothetical protein